MATVTQRGRLLFCDVRLLPTLAILLLVSACSLPIRTHAVPVAQSAEAEITGLPDVRYVVGNPDDMARLARDFAQSWQRERDWLKTHGKAGKRLPPTSFLALSGGGDQGAFGAGLLNGWTASGTRPSFKLVTGISTGALIAPFAFLGPAYDAKLRDFFTNTSSKDIILLRGWLAVLNNDALADSSPLLKLLRKQVDRPFLDEVAAEHAKGRELWISTTNLDSRQRVIWNMTRIAEYPDPRALELFHKIMLASASIPGAFPPVMIDVQVGGKAYQEMHVDGGATAQVFVYPLHLDFNSLAEANNADRHRSLYVIRNSRLDSEWAEVERKTMSIAARAISSLIQTQGVGDLYRLYLTAQRDELDFNLAYIPADFNHPHPQEFDTAYMRALYDVGYHAAEKSYPWQKVPPDFYEKPGQ